MKKLLVVPCLVMAVSAGGSMVSMAAGGWVQESGTWAYYNNSGDKAADVLKKSGNNWYYLDSEGKMVKDRLVEVNGDFYYMNSSGAAVTNEWRSVPNDSPSDGEPDE